MVGGWPDGPDGSKTAQATRHAITASGSQVSDHCFGPFNLRGSKIVKLLFSTETTARQGMFTLSKTIQKLQAYSADYKGVWISPERPPDQAYRRRALMNAADIVRALLLHDCDAQVRPDHLAGMVTYNRLPVLEIAGDGFLTATSVWHRRAPQHQDMDEGQNTPPRLTAGAAPGDRDG